MILIEIARPLRSLVEVGLQPGLCLGAGVIDSARGKQGDGDIGIFGGLCHDDVAALVGVAVFGVHAHKHLAHVVAAQCAVHLGDVGHDGVLLPGLDHDVGRPAAALGYIVHDAAGSQLDVALFDTHCSPASRKRSTRLP
ncbi:hypothetical protein SDC9_157098 [bioreactor metagenome]|uniref:Uncharacterized protein n=1 Tax=bioreactor metagenome TaxID=1076179 RepID=A0A645F864_9ZZZZ